LITRRILVSGRVQGVGYRRFIEKQALSLKLKGTVQNLANGDVEIMVHGPVADVDQLVAMAKQGPPFAHVREVAVSLLQWPEPPAHFSILKDQEF